MLVKYTDRSFPKKILLPTAGGEHALRAEFHARSFMEQGGTELEVCSVLPPNADQAAKDYSHKTINAAVTRFEKASVKGASTKIIIHNSIVDGIIEEGKNYDAVMNGATQHPFFRKFFFGNIPERIAKYKDISVILVKRYNPVRGAIERILED